MKTTANPFFKTVIVFGFFLLSSVGSNILIAKPAEAITWPEVGKLFGVWSRYIDDIQKTMYDQQQPTPQPTPSIDPQNPTEPPSNDLNQEFESIIIN
jgi:hypothetical protein